MQPWFRFYSGDYLLDPKVDALTLEAQGILIRLWCLCSRDGALPDDRKALARRAGIPAKTLGKYWDQVRIFFRIEDGLLVSDRLIREQARHTEIVEKRRESGAIGGQRAQANARAKAKQTLKLSLSESECTVSKETVSPPAPPVKAKAPRAKVEKLKPAGGPNGHLLEDDRPAFWEGLKAFPGQKAVNPTLAANAFGAAVATGQVTAPELAGCMRRYRATFADDRTQFMVQAHAWLDGAGFMAFLEEERRGGAVTHALGKARGEALTARGSGLDTYVMPDCQEPAGAVSGGL